ncbi:MAG: hypothetical protein R3C49_12145 [Planctomycetaceae bacterium]
MLILFGGKTVHRHQECSGCCRGTHATAARSPVPDQRPCPFGCQHHAPAGNSEDGDAPPAHDEHQCAVCSVLAQSPECPVVLTAPELSDLVVERVVHLVHGPALSGIAAVQNRGPPVVG